MSSFARSLRSLEADRGRGAGARVLGLAVLLAGWVAWFARAPVEVYATTAAARLEVSGEAHPVQAPVAGRVTAIHLALDREVRAGDVLVELDATTQALALGERRAQRAALAPQLAALDDELAAQERLLGEQARGSRAQVDEARARVREQETLAALAGDEAARAERLHAGGALPDLDLARATSAAQSRRAATEAQRLGVRRLAFAARAESRAAEVRLAELREDRARVAGDLAVAGAAIDTLEHEIARRTIRAPIAGRLGALGALHVGSVLAEGEQIALVVPPGGLKVVAEFPPAAVLGRVRPGQRARLRLDEFPWSEYGSVAAAVERVGTEVRAGSVRVELRPDPASAPRIPLQHGLPGALEIEVERATPGRLLLRSVGQWLAGPAARAGG